ncbi:MAG: hypothetical protein M1812_004070 [Candelaria pacifica]|nr:MAG: hypothetical protein M1812_004070 [Candelaria pacifica]
MAMIDRYTTAPVSSRLSAVSLPVSSDGNAVPPSPTTSMKTHPSATNPIAVDTAAYKPGSTHYSNPVQVATPHTYQPNAQAARQQPSQLDLSHVQQDATTARRGSRVFSSPATMDPQAYSQVPPQPHDPATSLTAQQPFGYSSLSHAEPRMFPGVVSRRRKSSVTKFTGVSSTAAGSDGQDGDMKSKEATTEEDESN